MSYRLISSNDIAIKYPEVNDMPCIYADLPNGMDGEHYVLEQEPKTGRCKDCKWWKDSDGVYRRGGHAESQCPINRREVLDGYGYCYMFEPQECEVNNE